MICPWCHADVEPVRVQGHDQCPACGSVIEACCEGEAGRETQGSEQPSLVFKLMYVNPLFEREVLRMLAGMV